VEAEAYSPTIDVEVDAHQVMVPRPVCGGNAGSKHYFRKSSKAFQPLGNWIENVTTARDTGGKCNIRTTQVLGKDGRKVWPDSKCTGTQSVKDRIETLLLPICPFLGDLQMTV
jgi:hypothetical protein